MSYHAAVRAEKRRGDAPFLCAQSAFSALGGAGARLLRPQRGPTPESHRRAEPRKAGKPQSGIEKLSHMGNTR
jgi:hypothetical protein